MNKRKIFAMVLSFAMVCSFALSAYATEMSAVYAGGKVSTTGSSLGFSYSSSSTIYWYPEVTANNGVYCAATVKCTFSKGLITSYDTCQITGLPASGICCFAGVQDSGSSVAYTSCVQMGDGSSTTAKVKHTSSTVYYTITFGKP